MKENIIIVFVMIFFVFVLKTQERETVFILLFGIAAKTDSLVCVLRTSMLLVGRIRSTCSIIIIIMHLYFALCYTPAAVTPSDSYGTLIPTSATRPPSPPSGSIARRRHPPLLTSTSSSSTCVPLCSRIIVLVYGCAAL